eukprot:1206629-Pyramimonas_sp.AAC.1
MGKRAAADGAESAPPGRGRGRGGRRREHVAAEGASLPPPKAARGRGARPPAAPPAPTATPGQTQLRFSQLAEPHSPVALGGLESNALDAGVSDDDAAAASAGVAEPQGADQGGDAASETATIPASPQALAASCDHPTAATMSGPIAESLLPDGGSGTDAQCAAAPERSPGSPVR